MASDDQNRLRLSALRRGVLGYMYLYMGMYNTVPFGKYLPRYLGGWWWWWEWEEYQPPDNCLLDVYYYRRTDRQLLRVQSYKHDTFLRFDDILPNLGIILLK